MYSFTDIVKTSPPPPDDELFDEMFTVVTDDGHGHVVSSVSNHNDRVQIQPVPELTVSATQPCFSSNTSVCSTVN
jgi:hypothetical protein